MKAVIALSCVLSFAPLAARSAPVPPGAWQRCQSAPENPKPTKPSSLVPHGHPGSHVYGAPIQSKILSRVKRKPHKPTAPPQ
jgi:hypothetical protein